MRFRQTNNRGERSDLALGSAGARAPESKHFRERSLKNQLAAFLAATGTDIEQMIGRTDDRFLVLDNEQGVALVTQVVHHPNEPADVARMKSDARLIHHEESVNERCAKAGGEVDALHFAAAQGAGRAIEREIAHSDFAKITEPSHDFGAQHLRRRVVRRNDQAVEKIARLRDRQSGKFRQGKGDAFALTRR